MDRRRNGNGGPKKWTEGRVKNVRALFTEEEHELLRQAAFHQRKSMSRFVIEAALALALTCVPPAGTNGSSKRRT